MRILIQPYTTTELAPFFNCRPRTFRRELARIKAKLGPRLGRRWSILQVELILDEMGRPYLIIER
ncbi:MAG: hypothetical protein ACXVNR_12995 [Bacteroidia bacterium]